MAGNVGAAAGAEQKQSAGESTAGESRGVEFNPFFERIAAKAPDWLLPKVSLPFLLATGYYLLHRLVFEGSELKLYPLLLAAIIFVVPVLVYLSTGIFREMLGQLDNRVGTGEAPAYPENLKDLLSDQHFLVTAVLFGGASTATARWMGLDVDSPVQSLTIGFGHFVAGAACGVAVWGVIGIVRTINAYVRHDQPRFDFTAPDGCGGMLFLGRAVTTFAIIALIGGVLVSSYILLAESALHSNSLASQAIANAALPAVSVGEASQPLSDAALPGDSDGHSDIHLATRLEAAMLWVWVIAPYVLATMVLLVPTFEIHNGLHAYKVREDHKIDAKLAQLDGAFNSEVGGADALKSLRVQHNWASDLRKMLYDMSTWPFSVNTHLKFALLMALNGLATFSTMQNESVKAVLDFAKNS